MLSYGSFLGASLNCVRPIDKGFESSVLVINWSPFRFGKFVKSESCCVGSMV